jgi:hypothetical protein
MSYRIEHAMGSFTRALARATWQVVPVRFLDL